VYRTGTVPYHTLIRIQHFGLNTDLDPEWVFMNAILSRVFWA
jgi:hypothetical protein